MRPQTASPPTDSRTGCARPLHSALPVLSLVCLANSAILPGLARLVPGSRTLTGQLPGQGRLSGWRRYAYADAAEGSQRARADLHRQGTWSANSGGDIPTPPSPETPSPTAASSNTTTAKSPPSTPSPGLPTSRIAYRVVKEMQAWTRYRRRPTDHETASYTINRTDPSRVPMMYAAVWSTAARPRG
jgi:hypothetical protein